MTSRGRELGGDQSEAACYCREVGFPDCVGAERRGGWEGEGVREEVEGKPCQLVLPPGATTCHARAHRLHPVTRLAPVAGGAALLCYPICRWS